MSVPFDPMRLPEVQELERLLGADYDGDGKVGGETLDIATQLERAAATHAAGRISDVEFQNIKARILGA